MKKVKVSHSFIKASKQLREALSRRRLETGFSMLEAVVVVGVLLALAVGGFFAYGPITENAKMAKVKSAASEILTAATVASFDGYSETQPQDVIDKWNASTDQIQVEILEPESGNITSNGDFCVQATNIADPKITARTGSCSNVTDGGELPDEITNPVDQPAVMISTWDTAAIAPEWAAACTTITLPLTGDVDVTVDWGDGTAPQKVTTELPSRPYSGSPGIKTIRIDGTFTGWAGADWPDWSYSCLTGVTKWGETATVDAEGGFYDTKLTSLERVPSTVTNMANLFTNSNFNQDISDWDTSRVTNMSAMFFNSSFNGDISDWDTSQVTNMYSMFYGSIFTGDISSWNTSKVSEMEQMFYESAFAGDLSRWNTTQVTDMKMMFMGAKAFNSDISGWDTSKVTEMNSMFQNASSFSQNLSGWDTSSLTNGSFFSFGSLLTPDQLPAGTS